MPDSEPSRVAGKLVPLRRPIDDEITLEPPRLEPLTSAQEAEAAELLAALFAASARRQADGGSLKDAA